MIIKVNLVLSVLLVTSCCFRLTVGGADVLRRASNGNGGSTDDADGMSQINKTADTLMLAELNGVASSTTESQGASDTAQVHRSRSLSIAATKDESKADDDGAVDSSYVKTQEKEKDIRLSSSLSLITSTTARSIRNGASSSRTSTSRDSKLMTLLAARRSALQHSHITGTRRRTVAPNRTLLEVPSSSASLSASKNANDPRTSCEKNCTKNFTRRTTASCIRRCLALQKSLNSTLSSTVRTRVDEKDNNEILETDESSHGFFVIAKDVNDTVNHIGDGGKSSEASTEKISRGAQKSSVSLDTVDIPPYLYFGQKLPPLKPSHKSNQTNDGIAKQSPDRTRSWRRNPQTRNFGSYRFHNSRNVIRPTTTPIVIAPTAELSKEQLPEHLATAHDSLKLKGEFLEDEPKGSNATETILLRSSSEIPRLASTESKTDPISIRANTTTLPTDATTLNSTISTSTPFQSHTIAQFTALTSSSTLETTSTNLVSRSFTSEPPATLKSSVNQFETSPVLFSFTTFESTTSAFMEQSNFQPIETTLPPPPPEELAKVFDGANEDKPNLIIFYNITTRQPTPPSPRVFTRTTISSSVRSTVNPKVRLPAETTSAVEYNLSSVSIESSTASIESSSGSSVIYNSFTPALQDVEAVTMVNGEVAIEVTRAHITTYVLAGLGMIPIVIIILYVTKTIIFKRRYKDDDDLDQFTSDGKPISPIHKMDHSEEDLNDQYSIVTERDFERANLRFKSLLGEGNFGQVWKAEADDLVGYMGTTRIVAVKTVRSGGTQVSLKDEAGIMRKLGSHPNVVTLLGTCLDTEPHLLIMEYAMRGRLLSLLRAARSATNILPASVPGGRSLAPLSPRTLAGFALDIARGMEYISEKKIVHRDLAARNVLLDHNGVCKICDFGMSLDLEQSQNSPVQLKKSGSLQQTQCFDTRFHFDFGGRWMNHWNNINNSHDKKHNHDSVSKRPALPIRWMAPEALQYHIFSIKTDVWAFGIVLWEIATLGCTPYPSLSGREVIRNVPNGARPELPHDGRPEFYELMQRCWRKDPPARPSFREARIEISRISCKWHDDDLATSDYMDVSGFSEDLEHGMVYFNRRISEFECEI